MKKSNSLSFLKKRDQFYKYYRVPVRDMLPCFFVLLLLKTNTLLLDFRISFYKILINNQTFVVWCWKTQEASKSKGVLFHAANNGRAVKEMIVIKGILLLYGTCKQSLY